MTKHYKVIVEHDKGKTTFIVPASSILAAREIVKKAENCPDRAILAVNRVKKFKGEWILCIKA